jgi:hypothetical protein
VGFARLVHAIHRLGIKPILFGREYSCDFLDNMPEMAQSIEFFDRINRINRGDVR